MTLEDYKNAVKKSNQSLLSAAKAGSSGGQTGTGSDYGTEPAKDKGQSASGGSTGSGSAYIDKLAGQIKTGTGTSAAVSQAQDYLQGVISGKPTYESSYKGQIADLYDQIMNRPKFSYDPNQDPLYSAYRDQYMQNGQLAMRDVMGAAAGLTGGYGNSWGDTAGFQAYQAYLQGLGGVIPELEQTAYSRYQDQGEDLLQKLAMAQGLEEADYTKYQNALANWQASQKKQTGTNSIFSKLTASSANKSGKTFAKAQGSQNGGSAGTTGPVNPALKDLLAGGTGGSGTQGSNKQASIQSAAYSLALQNAAKKQAEKDILDLFK